MTFQPRGITSSVSFTFSPASTCAFRRRPGKNRVPDRHQPMQAADDQSRHAFPNNSEVTG